MRTTIAFLSAIALGLALVMSSPPPLASAQAAPSAQDTETTTPIKHFVFLMQENHSFDNYFGTYPGADGIPEGVCMPVDPDDPTGECIRPYKLGSEPVEDLAHTADAHLNQVNGGKMDGFVKAIRRYNPDATATMGYYDDQDIPYYWNLADEYVLFDRFFTSVAGGSVSNHMFWVAGAAGNDEDAIPAGGFNIPTIFDRLQEAGISWKFYIQNYDPTINYRNPGAGDRGSQIIWAPLLSYDRFLDTPELFNNIVSLDQYFIDLENGTLPSVAYIVPSGASEHPPGSIKAGERFVRTLITGLMRSSAWSSSAFMWSYDDWGGFYDHVLPPTVDEWGYGFRAPALLVSPYARKGFIDSTELDFTSALKFIEENWGVEPLAERDRNANNFLTAFDFNTEPREPVVISAQRTPEQLPLAKSPVIYASYGTAVLIGSLPIAAGLAYIRRRGRGWRA